MTAFHFLSEQTGGASAWLLLCDTLESSEQPFLRLKLLAQLPLFQKSRGISQSSMLICGAMKVTRRCNCTSNERFPLCRWLPWRLSSKSNGNNRAPPQANWSHHAPVPHVSFAPLVTVLAGHCSLSSIPRANQWQHFVHWA